jgi:hypothetical protein
MGANEQSIVYLGILSLEAVINHAQSLCSDTSHVTRTARSSLCGCEAEVPR